MKQNTIAFELQPLASAEFEKDSRIELSDCKFKMCHTTTQSAVVVLILGYYSEKEAREQRDKLREQLQRTQVSTRHFIPYNSVFISRPSIYDEKHACDVWVVRPFINGASFADIRYANSLRGLPEATVAKIAAQALLALQDIHTKGSAHQNIYPSNVFITSNGIVQFADIHIDYSHLVRYGTADNFHLYPFVSPEAAHSEISSLAGGQADDIYRLAVCLLELACGKHLIELSDYIPPRIIHAIYNGEYKPVQFCPENSSPEFKDFIAAMTASAPQQRATIPLLLKHIFLYQNRNSLSKKQLDLHPDVSFAYKLNYLDYQIKPMLFMRPIGMKGVLRIKSHRLLMENDTVIKPTTQLDKIPVEIILLIANYLELEDICSLILVSHFLWHTLSDRREKKKTEEKEKQIAALPIPITLNLSTAFSTLHLSAVSSENMPLPDVKESKLLSNIGMFGDQDSGKWGLIYRLCELHPSCCSPSKKPKGIDFHLTNQLVADNENQTSVCLQIWRIPVVTKNRFNIYRTYLKRFLLFIFAFDLSNTAYVMELEKHLDQINEIQKNSPQAEPIVVATKCDKLDECNLNRARARSIISRKKLPYFETSAKNGMNIDELKEYLAFESVKLTGCHKKTQDEDILQNNRS